MKIVRTAGRLYDRTVSHMEWPQSILLLILRLAFGVALLQTGWGKLHNLEQTAGFFESLGIPFPAANAMFVGTVELVGGAFLALGLLSRLTAVPVGITMVVAYLTADMESVRALFSADYIQFFEAAPWPFLLVCLLVIVFGPGKLSLDALLPRILPRSLVQEIAPGSLSTVRA